MQIKNIIIHHTAVSRTRNNNQFKAVSDYHIRNGWKKIGYHYFIEPSGLVKAGRSDSEVGAHCKENSMNFRSLGICLAGNFDIEKPTNGQIFALRDLLKLKCSVYKLSPLNIYLHRDLATYKSCPGKNIDLKFIQSLIKL